MFSLVKNIFLNFSILKKNFIHFLLSLISIYFIIFIYISIVSGFVYLITKYVDYWFVFFYVLIFLTILIIFYSLFLFIRLYSSYLKWDKINIFKEHIIDCKSFFMFFKITFLRLILAIIPFLLLNAFIYLLVIIYWWNDKVSLLMQTSNYNSFSIISWIFALVSIFFIFYVLLKSLFAYFIFIDDLEKKSEKIKSAFYYVKNSFSQFKWFKKFINFFVVILTFLILISPFVVPLNIFSHNNEQVLDFINLSYNVEWTDNYSEAYKDLLNSKFWDSDLKQLTQSYLSYKNLENILNLLLFLLIIIPWLSFFLTSFYKLQIKSEDKKIKIKEENKELKVVVKKETKPKTKAKKTSVEKTWARETSKIEKKSVAKKTDKKVEKNKEKKKTETKKSTTKKTAWKKKIIEKTAKNTKKTTDKKEVTSVKRGRWRPRKTEK